MNCVLNYPNDKKKFKAWQIPRSLKKYYSFKSTKANKYINYTVTNSLMNALIFTF